MENKQVSHSKSRTNHPTLVGTLFFTLFNLVLLSILSWILLEVWFSVHIILLHDANSSYAIQKILNNNWMLTRQYHSPYIDVPFNILQHMKETTQSLMDGYVSRKSIAGFFDVAEITWTRACLFIKFLPLMLVILVIFIIDGLVLRDKRKFQGARESTFLFHRLKLLAKVLFFSLFFFYMANPYDTAPCLFLIPMAMLSGLFTMFSIKSFKKYL